MKKVILFAGFALLLAACSEKPGFQIAGTVPDATLNGQYVYLLPVERDAAPLDSALVNDGTFIFKGVQDMPALRMLRFNTDIIAPVRAEAGENSPFSAIFTLENAKLTAVLDSVSVVTGTPENDAFAAFQKEARAINEELSALVAGLKSDDEAAVAAVSAKYNELSDKLSNVAKAFISANTNKLLAGKTLYDFRYNLNEEVQNEIIANADSTFKSAPGVESLIEHLEVLKKVAVGQPFIDFEMPDVKGETRKLSDFIGKGYVLVDFWASWCPPCRKEMPNLVNLYKTYKKKGFEIVGVSLDSDQAAWEKGIKDLNITWPQLSDLKGWKNEGAALYGVNSIPHLVLIDKEGTIIAKNLHGDKLKEKIEELLK